MVKNEPNRINDLAHFMFYISNLVIKKRVCNNANPKPN